MSVSLFDANFYRAANSDLRNLSDTQALAHFQSYGLNEGRAFSPLADLNFYRASNGDLASFNNGQALNHLQNHGVREGRRFSQVLDLNFYRAINGDLATLNNEQLFEHLRQYGLNEGRRFSQFFDVNVYLANSPDVAQAFQGNRSTSLNHFRLSGLSEGRKFSIEFDVNYYRSVNADLTTAGLDNYQLLNHFESYGLSEGRTASEAFSTKLYLSNNGDLASAGFNYQRALEHFIKYGLREGRQASNLISSNASDNSFNTARSVFLDGNSVTFRDSISNSDTTDLYCFSVSTQRGTSFNLSLSGLNSAVETALINSNGQVIAQQSNGTGFSTVLAAGLYYVQVRQQESGAQSNYNLTVSTSPSTTGNTFADRVVDLTNAQRVQAGLRPLLVNLQLTSAAQTHSQNMALQDFFSHTGADGSSVSTRTQRAGYSSSYVGENIAAGYATPEEVVQGWMNSEGHRTNILNGNYRAIGVSYYYLVDDRGAVNYNSYWTQNFGAVV